MDSQGHPEARPSDQGDRPAQRPVSLQPPRRGGHESEHGLVQAAKVTHWAHPAQGARDVSPGKPPRIARAELEEPDPGRSGLGGRRRGEERRTERVPRLVVRAAREEDPGHAAGADRQPALTAGADRQPALTAAAPALDPLPAERELAVPRSWLAPWTAGLFHAPCGSRLLLPNMKTSELLPRFPLLEPGAR
jgi:hypothetical protein